jgi:tetratricopeptide (TPR) repeat protein
MNLGNALERLGGLESSPARLEEAVVAYGDASKEHTRDRVPLQWAMTQTNLGVVLKTLGDLENGGTARFEQAVAAHREALQVLTRERVPLVWAGTKTNLGLALGSLAERESGTAHLEEAIAAFGEALMELTRERAPLDWAKTQHNLASAHLVFFVKDPDFLNPHHLDDAFEAINGAIEEYRKANAASFIETAEKSRGQIAFLKVEAMAQASPGFQALQRAGKIDLETPPSPPIAKP